MLVDKIFSKNFKLILLFVFFISIRAKYMQTIYVQKYEITKYMQNTRKHVYL